MQLVLKLSRLLKTVRIENGHSLAYDMGTLLRARMLNKAKWGFRPRERDRRVGHATPSTTHKRTSMQSKSNYGKCLTGLRRRRRRRSAELFKCERLCTGSLPFLPPSLFWIACARVATQLYLLLQNLPL